MDEERRGRVSRRLVYHDPAELVPPPWPAREDLTPPPSEEQPAPPDDPPEAE